MPVQVCKLLIVDWEEFLFLKDYNPLRERMLISFPCPSYSADNMNSLSGGKMRNYASISVILSQAVHKSTKLKPE